MSSYEEQNLGIVSLTFSRLIHGSEAHLLNRNDELVRTLGALAISKRKKSSEYAGKESSDINLAMAHGLLTAKDGDPTFTNPHIQELAETWAVVEYLQPDYVDQAGMYDRAIGHLINIGAGAVPLLTELLDHKETSVAKGASIALGKIGVDAIPALQWAILYGNARVRYYALNALSITKEAVPLTKDLLNLVSTVLAEDGHALVQSTAVAVLSDTNHPIAVEALRRALDRPQLDSLTRFLIIDALKRLDTPEARRAVDDASRGTVSPNNFTPQGGWQIEAPQAKEAPVRVPRVFMSYAREDTAIMEEYARRLKLSGWDVWADSQHLVAGEHWKEQLLFAIGSSDFVVALLSQYTWDGYQRIEVEQAVANQKNREAPFLMPIFLSRDQWNEPSSNWPEGLKDIQHIVAEDFSSGWTQLYSSLSEATQMLGLILPQRLRSERRTDLTEREVWRTVFKKDFFSLSRNPDGKPLGNEWDLVFNEALAYDRATGLTWTRSPIVKECALLQALSVPQLFREKFKLAAHLPFRLPTVEEAMNLMTVERNAEDYHHNRYMSGSQYMLTCDTMPAPPGLQDVTMMVWVADFSYTDVLAVPVETPCPVWLVASD